MGIYQSNFYLYILNNVLITYKSTFKNTLYVESLVKKKGIIYSIYFNPDFICKFAVTKLNFMIFLYM